MQWAKWLLVATGLATVSCAGVVGAGAAVVVVGAGALAFTCYDRVSVTVTDRVTGRSLCDAKVSFFQGSSETEATSCYQAALSAGKYRLHVERPGLLPFDEPVVVSKGGDCGQTVQTIYVALDRAQSAPSAATPPPPTVLPPVNGTVPPSAAPAATTPPAAPPPAPVAPPPAAAPAPSAGTFPTAP